MWERKVITVSQLVGELAHAVEDAPALQIRWVAGELVEAKHHPASGHWYLTLGDAVSRLKAVMFRQDAQALGFQPQAGQQVAVLGQVRVYRPQGAVQLYVKQMEPLGAGAEKQALDALLARLRAEGLLSRPKRPLPVLPRAVGVVTSRSGAAVHDIITVAQRRFPGMALVVAPTAVQGDGAPAGIVAALARIAHHPGVDVVIVARGGGSSEDLAAFNDERVVRAVHACPRPVVSAVGHEIDTTLVDLVSDMRAPTPSAAAELAVPEHGQLARQLAQWDQRAARSLSLRIAEQRRLVAGYVEHGVLRSPQRLLAERRVALDRWADRAADQFRWVVAADSRMLSQWVNRLTGLDPTAVLARGFALVADQAGHPVTAQSVVPGQVLDVRWRDGQWRVTANAAVGTAPRTG